jgi:hypothetical protein
MRYRLAALACLTTMLLGLLSLPAQPPQPNEARVAWQLDLRYSKPRPIYVKVPGKSGPQLFWYFTFTVTNRTGEDRQFAPEILLYTHTGQMLRAGQGVNPIVFQHIKKLHNNPLLRDLVGITGKMLQGQDNARDGVAIFRDFDPEAARFDIFIGGLSGETATVQLPAPIKVRQIGPGGKEVTVEKKAITLAKTLDLTYRIGTETRNRIDATVQLLGKRWVMR